MQCTVANIHSGLTLALGVKPEGMFQTWRGNQSDTPMLGCRCGQPTVHLRSHSRTAVFRLEQTSLEPVLDTSTRLLPPRQVDWSLQDTKPMAHQLLQWPEQWHVLPQCWVDADPSPAFTLVWLHPSSLRILPCSHTAHTEHTHRHSKPQLVMTGSLAQQPVAEPWRCCMSQLSLCHCTCMLCSTGCVWCT